MFPTRLCAADITTLMEEASTRIVQTVARAGLFIHMIKTGLV